MSYMTSSCISEMVTKIGSSLIAIYRMVANRTFVFDADVCDRNLPKDHRFTSA